MAISQCGTATAEDGQELLRHGTALFPAACYRDALTRRPLPWHWHEELEAGILLSGAAELAAGGARFSLAAGDAFFVNTGVPHSLRGAPEGALRSLCFHPRLVGGSEDSVDWQTYLRPVVDGRFPRALRLSGREDRDAGEWIGRAWQAVAEGEAGFELEARYALSRLLRLLRERFPAADARSAGRALRTEQRLRQMLDCIRAGYGGELRMEDIAASAAVSISECLRCFDEAVGMPPMRYLRLYRLRRAAALLTATDLPVGEVGRQCGFGDPSYFAGEFRRRYGVSPSRYRLCGGESGAPLPEEDGF